MAMPMYRTQMTSDNTPLEYLCCGCQVFVCVECGKYRMPGDWPLCPHAPGNFGDEPLEPYVDEHIRSGGTDVGYDLHGNKVVGTLITSRGQRAQIMREEGLEFRKKKAHLVRGRTPYFDMGRR